MRSGGMIRDTVPFFLGSSGSTTAGLLELRLLLDILARLLGKLGGRDVFVLCRQHCPHEA